MTHSFGWASTTDEVLSGIDLKGRSVLITGVSSGLGVETARALAAHGAEVVGLARDLAKAERATKDVHAAARQNGTTFEVGQLDLANLASIRTCTDRLLADGRQFDIIIANAGVMATPQGVTADGFETQFGTNHLGHFVLVNRLASLIRDGGRLVILSSGAHRISDVNIEDPNFEHTEYEKWVAYGRSKTANALFAVEFDRRHRNRNIRAVAVHPGGIQTELQRHYPAEDEQALVDSINKANAAAGLPPFQYKSVQQGAATSVWAAIVAPSNDIGGRYCEDCHVAETDDTDGFRNGVRSYAQDTDRAKALWAKSEQMVGDTY
ncbi:SDR family NAD(P)-dependent oxidoreductase [Ochrobactrum sp. EDr1-4]|uniref:SDR family NAD(P)-dependent oxidoreductase n=1 Tax=Ochrobactrum sp. EDr1-4 TaxID=3368622 RepID=UPI003B9DD2ED